MSALLETHGLDVFYRDFQALFGVEVSVAEGETISIIGANGAGKSSFLAALSGLAGSRPEQIRLDGKPVGGTRPFDMVKLGVALVPEGRKLFPSLTVEENLQIGAEGRAVDRGWSLDSIYALFPILKERRLQPATVLSGGQQQMVAIGRALMANPRILLCDEISLGLSPAIVRDVYAALAEVKRRGTTIIVVEQDLGAALRAADRVYCLMEGRVSLSGRPADLTHEAIQAAYFGAAA
jgi:branched-chain amino acid transport system ATP-binding protein